MNAGKSTILLQSSYNYRERGMHTLVLSPVVDDRFGIGKVSSRIGLQSESIALLAYGLRTDFQGNLFEGSQQLMAWADTLNEVKTICHCGRKATMVLRMDSSGKPVRDGEQIQIGGNERYVSVCRKHFKAGLAERSSQDLPFDDL